MDLVAVATQVAVVTQEGIPEIQEATGQVAEATQEAAEVVDHPTQEAAEVVGHPHSVVVVAEVGLTPMAEEEEAVERHPQVVVVAVAAAHLTMEALQLGQMSTIPNHSP